MAERTEVSSKKLGRTVAAASVVVVGVGAVLALVPAVSDRVATATDGYRYVGAVARTLGPRLGSWAGFGLMILGGVTLSRWRHLPKRREYKGLIAGAATLMLVAGGLGAFEATTAGPHGTPVASTGTPAAKSTKASSSHHPPTKHTRSRTAPKAKTKTTTSPVGVTHATGEQPVVAPSPTPAPPKATGGAPSSVAPTTTPTTPNGGVDQTNSGAPNNDVTLTNTNSQQATSGAATGQNATSGPATNSNNESFNFG